MARSCLLHILTQYTPHPCLTLPLTPSYLSHCQKSPAVIMSTLTESAGSQTSSQLLQKLVAGQEEIRQAQKEQAELLKDIRDRASASDKTIATIATDLDKTQKAVSVLLRARYHEEGLKEAKVQVADLLEMMDSTVSLTDLQVSDIGKQISDLESAVTQLRSGSGRPWWRTSTGSSSATDVATLREKKDRLEETIARVRREGLQKWQSLSSQKDTASAIVREHRDGWTRMMEDAETLAI